MNRNEERKEREHEQVVLIPAEPVDQLHKQVEALLRRHVGIDGGEVEELHVAHVVISRRLPQGRRDKQDEKQEDIQNPLRLSAPGQDARLSLHTPELSDFCREQDGDRGDGSIEYHASLIPFFIS